MSGLQPVALQNAKLNAECSYLAFQTRHKNENKYTSIQLMLLTWPMPMLLFGERGASSQPKILQLNMQCMGEVMLPTHIVIHYKSIKRIIDSVSVENNRAVRLAKEVTRLSLHPL